MSLVSTTPHKPPIITRRFGLTPVVRCPKCQTECQKVKKNERKRFQPQYYCSQCKQVVDAPIKKLLPSNLFQNVAKATNALIQFGITLSSDMFERESLIAMKRFYNCAKKDPKIQKVFNHLGFHNRLQRCTAQYAYYAVQEYHRRTQIVQLFAQHLSTQLRTPGDLTIFSQTRFPSRKLVQEGRELIEQQLPAYGYVSTAFLQNLWRYVRNLLVHILEKQEKPRSNSLFKELTFPKEVRASLLGFLPTQYEECLKSFLITFSKRLTSRTTRLKNRQRPEWGQGTFDPLLAEILGTTLKETPNFAQWEAARKKWRDSMYLQLSQLKSNLNFADILEEALQQVQNGVSFLQILRRLVSTNTNKPRLWYTLDVEENWRNYLQRELESQLWINLIDQCQTELFPFFHRRCRLLITSSRDWIKVPVFEKAALPYGADDGQVFRLWVGPTEQSGDPPIQEDSLPVYVRLIVAPQTSYEFRLNTPARFHRLMKQGFKWLKPILSKSAKGTLILALPFQSPVRTGKNPQIDRDRRLSVDLGLKTLATLSVVEGLAPLPAPQSPLTPNAYAKLFHNYDITQFEIARYFLDQRELHLPADQWFLLEKTTLKGKKDYKRALYHLQKTTAHMKSLQAQYRNRHKTSYTHKKKYWRRRRQWKRLWRKLKALHEELARQIAIRILSVACYYQIQWIRFEDLRWAHHSAKADCGYWLATWQVHWFYSQIQARVAERALHLGIKVETVNPRETSKRCSHCGRLGKRNGKIFHCSQCGITLDSDLNAARNIHLVPSSPVAICDRVQPPEAGYQ